MARRVRGRRIERTAGRVPGSPARRRPVRRQRARSADPLGAAGVYLLFQTGRSEAIRNAKEVTALAAHGVVEPNITQALMRGDPAAIARLDRSVHGLLGYRVVRVKLWRADGRILDVILALSIPARRPKSSGFSSLRESEACGRSP